MGTNRVECDNNNRVCESDGAAKHGKAQRARATTQLVHVGGMGLRTAGMVTTTDSETVQNNRQ